MLGLLREKIRETIDGPGAPVPAPENAAQDGSGEARLWRNRVDEAVRIIDRLTDERDAAREDLGLMQAAAGRAQDKAARLEREALITESTHRKQIDRLMDELEKERDAHDMTDREYDRYVLAQEQELNLCREKCARLLSRNRLYEQEVYAAGREIARLRERGA